MSALMLTATHPKELADTLVRTSRPEAGVLRNCSLRAVAAWEVTLEITESGACLPPESPGSMHVRREHIAAATTETLDSFCRRMEAGFASAWRSGACVTLARIALGGAEPVWGWGGREAFIEALVLRAADQLVERYEIIVAVPASPRSELGARSFDLLDRLLRVTDPRGMLRLQFAH